MVVGHEPDFTRTIFQLTGGNTKMSKAGVALIELETGADERRVALARPAKIRDRSIVGLDPS